MVGVWYKFDAECMLETFKQNKKLQYKKLHELTQYIY